MTRTTPSKFSRALPSMRRYNEYGLCERRSARSKSCGLQKAVDVFPPISIIAPSARSREMDVLVQEWIITARTRAISSREANPQTIGFPSGACSRSLPEVSSDRAHRYLLDTSTPWRSVWLDECQSRSRRREVTP